MTLALRAWGHGDKRAFAMNLLIPLAVALCLAGCASRQCCDTPAIAGAMKIELLRLPTCPNTPAMRENLRAALKSIDGGLTFAEVNQEALAAGDTRRGWPAPTVLVNGADLFGMAAPTRARMTCRVYDDGVPSVERIGERVRGLVAE